MGFSLFMQKGSFLLPSPRVMWAKVRGRYVLGLGFRLRAIFLHLSSLFLTQASRQAGCFKFQSPRLEGWVGHKLFKLSYNVEHGSRPERYSDLILGPEPRPRISIPFLPTHPLVSPILNPADFNPRLLKNPKSSKHSRRV